MDATIFEDHMCTKAHIDIDNQTGLHIQGDDYRAVTKLIKDGASNEPSIIEQRSKIPTADG